MEGEVHVCQGTLYQLDVWTLLLQVPHPLSTH